MIQEETQYGKVSGSALQDKVRIVEWERGGRGVKISSYEEKVEKDR